MLDAEYYDAWAQRIAGGDWIGKDVFFMSPGYPYLLGVLYFLFGRSLLLVACIQMVTGALGCVLIFRIAEKTFGKNEARVASALFAVYGAALFNESMLLKAASINFLNLLMLLVLLKGTAERVERGGGRWLFLAGGLLGLSAQFRPTILLFAPLAGLWVIGHFISARPMAWAKPLAIFCLGVAAVITPVALRNELVAGQFIMTTAHGGINFFLGNHTGFNGTYAPVPFARTDPQYEQKDFKREAEKRTGKSLSDQEASDFWYAETWRDIRSQPLKWLENIWKKFVVFWNAYEYPINVDYNFFSRKPGSLLRFLPVGFGLIASTALLGMVLLLPRMRSFGEWTGPQGALWLYCGAYLASGVLFFVVSEYRMPVVPVLVMFSGKALGWLWEEARLRRARRLLAGLAALAVFWAFTHIRIPISQDCNSQYNVALYLIKQKKLPEAAAELERAASSCPKYFDVRLSLADVYRQGGDVEKASHELTIAGQLNPDDPRVNLAFGDLFLQAQRYEEAAASYREALARAAPDSEFQVEIHTGLGNALAFLGRLDEAEEQYNTVLRADPKAAPVYNNLAFIFLSRGDRKGAVGSYLRAIELKPDYLNARIKLAQLLMDMGRFEEALSQLEAADRQAPGQPWVQSALAQCREKIRSGKRDDQN